jgi:predicted PurR-regulated permease PerM
MGKSQGDLVIIGFLIVLLILIITLICGLICIDNKIDTITTVIKNIQAEQHEIKKDVQDIKSVKTDQIHQELNKLRLEFPNLRNQIYLNQSKLQEVLNIWAEILKARKK